MERTGAEPSEKVERAGAEIATVEKDGGACACEVQRSSLFAGQPEPQAKRSTHLPA